MRNIPTMLLTAALLAVGAPNALAQSPGPRVNVDIGVGSHFRDGGDVESLSVGYAVLPALRLVGTVARDHTPTRVEDFAGGFSATRGGTLTSVSGEAQFFLPGDRPVSPYGTIGFGRGRSQLNVNDHFPDPVTTTDDVIHLGGGVRIWLRPQIGIFADARLLLAVQRGVGSELSATVPIRGGVTWRF